MKANKYKAFSSTLKGFSAEYSEKNVARGLGPVPDGTGLGHSPILLPDDEGLAEDSARTHASVFLPRGSCRVQSDWCVLRKPLRKQGPTQALLVSTQKPRSQMFSA